MQSDASAAFVPMTPGADSYPDPSRSVASADLQIHKVISRGWGTDAQVLLVLASTGRPLAAGEDVWVGVDRNEPVAVPLDGRWQAIESCRPLNLAELEALDLGWRAGEKPFDIDVAVRRCWLARFDHSDHELVKAAWDQISGSSGKEPLPRSVDIVAWISRPETRSDREPLESTSPLAVPTSDQALMHVALSDVLYQPLFELGVLFVHGIGKHGVRETLVSWAEPIVKLWRDYGRGISQAAHDRLPDDERHRIARRLRERQLRNRIPIDGIAQASSDFEEVTPIPKRSKASTIADARPTAQAGAGPMPTSGEVAPEICFTYAKAEQTLFGDIDSSVPSATLLRLSSVDSDAVLRESHVLFAEAFWTRETFPPTYPELYGWLTTAIPIAIWSRLQRLTVSRPSEIASFWRNAKSGFDRFRVVVSIIVLALQWLVMPAAYVAFAFASQIFIGLIGVVGFLPIPWLESLTRRLMSALMGTLGQSFALQNSVVRRAAIVSSVRSNLDWLSDRCHRVVVLSHSQGVEISRLVFLDGPREKLVRWYTAGSGIVPLAMLHPRSLAADVTRAVIKCSRFALVIVAGVLLLIAIDTIPGVSLGVRSLLTQWLRHLGAIGIGIFLVGLVIATLLFGASNPPAARLNLRKSVLNKMRDFYASEDPVPAGSLVDRYPNDFAENKIAKPPESRIFNTRFSFLDHTSYFRNVEQFVAPIALELLRFMGMGFDERLEQRALLRAAARRDLLTWWNMFVSVLGLCAFAVTFAWTVYGPSHRSAAWLARGETIWSKVPGTWDRIQLAWSSGYFGMVMTDCVVSLVILALLVAWWALCRYLGDESSRLLVDELAADSRGIPTP